MKYSDMLGKLTPTRRCNSLQERRQPLRTENNPGFQINQNLGHLILQLQRNKFCQKSKWTWKQIVSQSSHQIRAPTHLYCSFKFSSVQFSCSVEFDPLWHHGLQHARLPCPSPTPGAYSNSCPVMPSSHLILCHPLLLLPSIFPRISAFSSESVLPIRWTKYWSFSFSISPSNSGLVSFRMDWKTPVFLIFIGVWLIYNIVLLSAVQQSVPVINTHTYTHTHTHTHKSTLF